MSIVDRIQLTVKERGSSLKQLERDCGIGNGTIRRWEEQSPRLDILEKVANFLQVSLDYLVYGDSKLATSCDGTQLSQMEADLVAMFRLLDSRGRENGFDFIAMLYEKATGEKGSIYLTYIEDDLKQKSGPAMSHETQDGTA